MREIAAISRSDRHPIVPGDIVCLHTGFADELLKMERTPDPDRVHNMCAALDGRDQALLDWISLEQIAAIAADNYAVERICRATNRSADRVRPAAPSLPVQAGRAAG